MGGAVLVRLQAAVEAGGIRRGEDAPRPRRPHLATGHRPLQQVRQCSHYHACFFFTFFAKLNSPAATL